MNRPKHTIHTATESMKYHDTTTVWPEILVGRYFGRLLKIFHLAEFTLAIEPVSAIIILIAKWHTLGI